MLNVTIKFTVYCMFFLFCGCTGEKNGQPETELQHFADSVAEQRIDSAYEAIRNNCDTMMVYRVPVMVDSFLKDSSSVQRFFDPSKQFTDADKKVEKVIRQLQADCDSSLLQETYRRARLRQRSKPVQHTRAKA